MNNVHDLFPREKPEDVTKVRQMFDEQDVLFCLAGRNKQAATCKVCGECVPRGKGYLFKDAFSDDRFVTHRGDCDKQGDSGVNLGAMALVWVILMVLITGAWI
jgi:hypothetical protein